jgi:hypothetical protein
LTKFSLKIFAFFFFRSPQLGLQNYSIFLKVNMLSKKIFLNFIIY